MKHFLCKWFTGQEITELLACESTKFRVYQVISRWYCAKGTRVQATGEPGLSVPDKASQLLFDQHGTPFCGKRVARRWKKVERWRWYEAVGLRNRLKKKKKKEREEVEEGNLWSWRALFREKWSHDGGWSLEYFKEIILLLFHAKVNEREMCF